MKQWLLLHWQVPVLCLVVLNLIAFSLMGADKRRARRNQWRISERALFLSALLGGSPGALLGMHVFHHKTRHWYFRLGIPAILIGEAALFTLLWLR